MEIGLVKFGLTGDVFLYVCVNVHVCAHVDVCVSAYVGGSVCLCVHVSVCVSSCQYVCV